MVSGEQELRPFIDGPFRQLYEGSEAELPPGYVTKLQNFYIDRGRILGRPGTVQLGGSLAPAPAPAPPPFPPLFRAHERRPVRHYTRS